eukprot:4445828-Pyramimonas_sp.AAC.1
MADDAASRLGPQGEHQARSDHLYGALYDGAETELAPLFHNGDSAATQYLGRQQGSRYRESTSGGALARFQPSGTQ